MSFKNGFMTGAGLALMFASVVVINTKLSEQKECEKTLENILESVRIEYINNDSLPALVYKTGQIYLQKKDGSFVPYGESIKQEKAKLDSIYQAKKDSLRKIYEGNLERGLK